MKRNTILEFNKLANEVLFSAQKVKDVNPKFLYGLKKNKDKIQSITVEFQKKIFERKQHEKADEFQNKRVELCKVYARLDDKGEPIIKDNQFQFDQEKYQEFQEKFKDLQEEYTEVVEDNKNFEEEINKILEEEMELDIYKVKVDWLPTGVITGDQLTFLYDNGFIED